VASTFASSFDKSTEDEKATVDKRGLWLVAWGGGIYYFLLTPSTGFDKLTTGPLRTGIYYWELRVRDEFCGWPKMIFSLPS
jgi:hypothetical protein